MDPHSHSHNQRWFAHVHSDAADGGVVSHSSLTGVTANQHHNQAHTLAGGDHSGNLTQSRSHDSPDTDTATTALHHTLGTGANQASAGNHSHAHSALTGVGANDHHNQAHVLDSADHTVSGLTSGHVLKATGSTTYGFGQLAHTQLGSVGANDHHNQSHSISGGDHTGTLSLSQLPTFPTARATRAAASTQSISNTTNTAINFTTEDFDNDSMHDNSTNNTRITFNTAGKYILTASVEFDTNSTGGRGLHFRVNGSTYISLNLMDAVSSGQTYMNTVTEYAFSASDYVEAIVYQSSGGSLNICPSQAASLTAAWVAA